VTKVDRRRVATALFETWDSIAALCASLPPDEWRAPTDCPGWTVQDHVSHMIGTESMLDGRPAPDVAVDGVTYLRNEIGRTNEAWVEARRASSPAAVLDEFRAVTATRRRALEAMTQDDFDADARTPAGPDTFGRFMQIRVMDCWMHEQDIREAVHQPGHESGLAVEVALDEVVGALGYVVGKQAGAPQGSSVRFALTGSAARTVDVVVAERARVAEAPVDQPSTTLTMPVTTFMRLAGGRRDAAGAIGRGDVEVSGDAALGQRVTARLPYMI
jgi:uncharacterized protein (TIGR03083 family)